MIRSELINRIAAAHPGLSPADITIAVKTILRAMANTLSTGGRIEIRGFGSFDLRYYSGRSGRNPRTGEAFRVPPKYRPSFKAGKEMRARINDDEDSAAVVPLAAPTALPAQPRVQVPARPRAAQPARADEHELI